MEFEYTIGDETVDAVISGRLDTAAAVEFATQIQPLLDNADKVISLNCKNLEYISSSGLRSLLMLRKAAGDKGGSVVIKYVNDDIDKILQMTGFSNLFQIIR